MTTTSYAALRRATDEWLGANAPLRETINAFATVLHNTEEQAKTRLRSLLRVALSEAIPGNLGQEALLRLLEMYCFCSRKLADLGLATY